MKILGLLIILFAFIGCEDKITENKNTITTTPAICPEFPAGNEPSPIHFVGIDKIDNITSNTVDVSWIHQDGIYQYHVISILNDRQDIIKTVNAPSTSVTVTDLKPDTEYTFIVRAIDQSGYLDANFNKVVFRTLPALTFANAKSLKFNGNQYVDLGTSSNFNMAGGKSISLWFKPTNITVQHEVFVDRLFTLFHSDDAHSGFSVGLKPNKIYLIYTNKRNIQKSLQVGVGELNNKWNHLLATYDNAFITIYLNGVEVLQINDTLKSFGSHPGRIGAFNYRFGFHGLIDEFAFWGAPFNAQEASDLFNHGMTQDLTLAVKKNQLNVWYRMGDHGADSANHLQDIMNHQHGIPRVDDQFTFAGEAP